MTPRIMKDEKQQKIKIKMRMLTRNNKMTTINNRGVEKTH
jgi:hypothetical protein